MLAEDIKRDPLTLSVSKRASIAHELILSLDDPSGLNLVQEQESEIRRRVQMVKEGKESSQPVDHLFAEIEAKLK